MSLLHRFPLLSYFVLAYALTWVIELPMALGVRGVIDVHLPLWVEAFAAFGPFVAAVIVLRVTRGAEGVNELLASLGRWRVSPFWAACSSSILPRWRSAGSLRSSIFMS